VPWVESFLRLRRDCFQATGDVRLAEAERGLRAFVEGTARPLVAP
jgi:hypothetical protein